MDRIKQQSTPSQSKAKQNRKHVPNTIGNKVASKNKMKRLGQKGRAYAHEKGARTEQRSKDRTKEQGQNKGVRTEQRSKDRRKQRL